MDRGGLIEVGLHERVAREKAGALVRDKLGSQESSAHEAQTDKA